MRETVCFLKVSVQHSDRRWASMSSRIVQHSNMISGTASIGRQETMMFILL